MAPSGIVTVEMTVPVAPAAPAAPDTFYYVTLIFELPPPPPPGTWRSLTILVLKAGGVRHQTDKLAVAPGCRPLIQETI